MLVTAPAKLTTSLRVTGRRSDGYHLIDAEMVSLDLADSLEIEEAEMSSLQVVDEVDWCGLPERAPSDGTPSSNGQPDLVEAALQLAGRNARCLLRKRVPSGAGLGGGSSDAAAVLRWAGLSDPSLAARLGADVPFCLVGGAARVRGIGEVVEPIDGGGRARTAYLLVTPRLQVATPAVYGAWDELGGPRGDGGNDLEPAALAAYPLLAWWRDLLAAASGIRPRLAGSGGTWFVEGEPGSLGDLAAQVRAEVVGGREQAMVAVAGTSRAPAATHR